MNKRNITTKEEARQYAIDWQAWASKQNLSYGELAEWQGIFTALAHKFDLMEEFTENGIIAGEIKCICSCGNEHMTATV